MEFGQYRLKLNENKNYSGGETPKYTLSYKTDLKKSNSISYSILSKLVQDNDVVIEFSTEWFNNTLDNYDELADVFLDNAMDLNLKYSHRKIPSAQGLCIFGFRIQTNKKNEAHEIAVYVPNKVWMNEKFRGILPVCGARYYVTKMPMDEIITVDNIMNMSDEEKKNIFRLIVFDLTSYGQMGISAGSLETDDIRRLLGI